MTIAYVLPIMAINMFSSKNLYNSTASSVAKLLRVSQEVVRLKEMIKNAFQTLPPPAELEGAGNGKHYKDQEMQILSLSICRSVPLARNIQIECYSLF